MSDVPSPNCTLLKAFVHEGNEYEVTTALADNVAVYEKYRRNQFQKIPIGLTTLTVMPHHIDGRKKELHAFIAEKYKDLPLEAHADFIAHVIGCLQEKCFTNEITARQVSEALKGCC